MKTVIFANGQLTNTKKAIKHAHKANLIIAVDGGAEHCRRLNILPHILLGDLDSIQPDLVKLYEKEKVIIQRHPTDKDKTDLELALDLAAQKQATTVAVFGALGQRWDMSIANLLLPTAPAYASLDITLFDGATRIHLIRSGTKFSLSATPGSAVSLIPINGAAKGVTLQGFTYPLTNQTIAHASTRGVSNVLSGQAGTIALETGMLLCIVDES